MRLLAAEQAVQHPKRRKGRQCAADGNEGMERACLLFGVARVFIEQGRDPKGQRHARDFHRAGDEKTENEIFDVKQRKDLPDAAALDGLIRDLFTFFQHRQHKKSRKNRSPPITNAFLLRE